MSLGPGQGQSNPPRVPLTVQLLPLLLRSLSLPHSAQRVNTIVALTSVLETANLAANVDTLLHVNAVAIVDALLKSALRDPNVEPSGVSQLIRPLTPSDVQAVRTSALRCLGVFPDAIRYEVLRGEKSRVVRDLGRALDDPLRSARKEAVECRAKWWVCLAGG